MPELERDRPAVSALGDLWKLGQHLLLCGSALEEASYQKLLGDSAPRWCSPTRLTTLRSTAMSVVWARSTTPTSKWRPAR